MAPQRLSAFVIAGAMIVFAPALASAQTRDFGDLSSRVDRLQRDIDTLQRQVFQGRTPPQSGGGLPADTRLQADMQVRLDQLENQLNVAQGRNEEVDHQLALIRDRLDKLSADMERRLAAIERGGAAPAPSSPPMTPQATTPAPGPAPAPSQGSAAPGLGAPPRALGTIPADAVPQGPPPEAPASPAALPAGTTQQQYEYATAFLQKQDYPSAETALKSFVAAHPKDPLAGSAQFWLGETHFVRKDYQSAAFAYAEGIEKFPQGTKAADSLLKLGMSLARLGKNDQACTALSRLQGSFPGANETVKRRATAEQQRIKCKV